MKKNELTFLKTFAKEFSIPFKMLEKKMLNTKIEDVINLDSISVISLIIFMDLKYHTKITADQIVKSKIIRNIYDKIEL